MTMIESAPGSGMWVRKAQVKALGFPYANDGEWHYRAEHMCGWAENLRFWHSAFWAADHHMRYDCGRRKQPSSGGYITRPVRDAFGLWNEGVALEDPSPAFTVRKMEYWQPMSEERYQDLLADAHAAEPFWQRAGEVMEQYLNEGGMRNDPTPSNIGDPLPPESAEDPTVELGAITTELGPLPGLGWAGSTGERRGIDGALWWERLWGRRGQR